MAAVMRVRRLYDDAPAEVFLVTGNKEEGDHLDLEDSKVTVLDFAGTLWSRNKELSSLVSNAMKLKEKCTHSYKQYHSYLARKMRSGSKTKSGISNHEFKIVSDLKGSELSNTNLVSETDNEDIFIVRLLDVVQDEEEDPNPKGDIEDALEKESEVLDLSGQNYVYDIYCTSACNLENISVENLYVHPLFDGLFHDYLLIEQPSSGDKKSVDVNYMYCYPDVHPEFVVEDGYFWDYEQGMAPLDEIGKKELIDEFRSKEKIAEEGSGNLTSPPPALGEPETVGTPESTNAASTS